jgi:nitrate reductase NapAB chaperone NapD
MNKGGNVPVCSYVVFPEDGRTTPLLHTLNQLPGCEARAAENREMLILVTSTDTAEADRALRERLEAERDIQCLVMAFGEIDPETEEADPVAALRRRERGQRPGVGRGQ